jgi:hypothetical protein
MDRPWGVLFSYDVEPVDPDERLVAASLESFQANYNFLLDGVLEIETDVYSDGPAEPPLLATLTLTEDSDPGSFFEAKDLASFAPQRNLKVVTAVKLAGEAAFTSLVHSFARAPESVSNSDADFDSDGDVDGADFLAWQKGVGSESATQAEGDANGDGVADAADLEVWKQQAVGAAHAASHRAAEPAASTITLLGIAPLLARRRRVAPSQKGVHQYHLESN